MKFKSILVSIFLSFVIMVFLLQPEKTSTVDIFASHVPNDVEDYIKDSESAFSDIRPGTEKKIIWNNPSVKAKTHYSIIYLHGFSASRQETAPLCDIVASKLHANLFYTRLTGHGRPSEAMEEASAATWQHDAVEALDIGRRLGDKVIVIGSSTGGTLATWLAQQDSLASIAALVLISPNFGPKNKWSTILSWPKANIFVPFFLGKNRSWTPYNSQQGKYWMTTYPYSALIAMMQLVQSINELDFEDITTPTLFIYSENDQVVDFKKTEAVYNRFPQKSRDKILVSECGDPSNHVLAGDVLSPKNTQLLAEEIVIFIKSIYK